MTRARRAWEASSNNRGITMWWCLCLSLATSTWATKPALTRGSARASSLTTEHTIPWLTGTWISQLCWGLAGKQWTNWTFAQKSHHLTSQSKLQENLYRSRSFIFSHSCCNCSDDSRPEVSSQDCDYDQDCHVWVSDPLWHLQAPDDGGVSGGLLHQHLDWDQDVSLLD